jgi:hypothetical protein
MFLDSISHAYIASNENFLFGVRETRGNFLIHDVSPEPVDAFPTNIVRLCMSAADVTEVSSGQPYLKYLLCKLHHIVLV